jgi:hypothetical protein
LIDTRTDGDGPLQSTTTIPVPAPAGVDPDAIAALVVTVSATGGTSPGWLQAYPSADPGVIARTSTVNFLAGETVANTAIVPAAAGAVSIAGFLADGSATHVVVDAIGYVTSAAAPTGTDGRFVAVRPARAYDSRVGSAGLVDGATVDVDGSSAHGVDIPDDASGIVWNIAIVEAQRPGFVSAWASGGIRPTTSALNWIRHGETRAAATISAVSDGSATFLIEDGSANLPGPVGGLIADVFGYFT